MITHLVGTLDIKKAPTIVIDVNGVGYEVLAPMSTFYQLPDVGAQIKLLTHLSISENSQTLFGFHVERERSLFRALIKVSGVGPKLALTILSGMEADQFVHCIQIEDTTSLVKIPGIGKKTAERLIIEMRDALSQWQHNSDTQAPEQPHLRTQNQQVEDAISALSALGYKPAEAKRAVEKIQQPAHNSEQLIRLALQQMVRR